MRSRIATIICCVLSLATFNPTFGQIGGPGPGGGGGGAVTMFGTNNSGFVQTGLNGPDNLVMFDLMTVPPDDPNALPPVMFTVVGNLESDMDVDNDGALDSLGTFSGLEWSTGQAGVGTLIGCVLNEGNGSGEFYQIDPATADTLMIGQSPVVDGEQRDFSDLAFNPADGLMYGLMNDIIEDGNNNFDFGPNTIWVDTDGDLVPDTVQRSAAPAPALRTDPLCFGELRTMASGLAFDQAGTLFVYDIVNNLILAGGLDSSTQNTSPCAVAFADSNLDTTETTQGNALSVDGTFVLFSTDVPIFGLRNTIVSFIDLEAEEPESTASGMFGMEFFQTGFQASVAVGDMVSALPDVGDLEPNFPNALIVNNGIPAKDAVLESIVATDDLRYCITSAAPNAGVTPVDMTAIFTIPDAANTDALVVAVELNTDTANIALSLNALNVNTGQFDFISSTPVTRNNDATATADLSSTLDLDDYLDRQTGQLIVRMRAEASAPTLFFPWQIKINTIVAGSGN